MSKRKKNTKKEKHNVPIENPIKSAVYPSAEILKEACLQEYQNEREKYNKLYDKVNIALAFCGLIFFEFVRLLDFTALLSNNNPITNLRIVILILYCILILITLGLFLWALFDLLNLAKGKRMALFDCLACRDEKKYRAPVDNVALWLVEKYTSVIAENKRITEDKQKKYNSALTKVILSIVFFIVTYVFSTHII